MFYKVQINDNLNASVPQEIWDRGMAYRNLYLPGSVEESV